MRYSPSVHRTLNNPLHPNDSMYILHASFCKHFLWYCPGLLFDNLVLLLAIIFFFLLTHLIDSTVILYGEIRS